jgi:hypothetical protein
VKKGVKNQLKSWGSSLFGKAGGETGREGVVEGAEPRYLFNSVEAQIRSLAEAAAMLQDWDLAISSYKLLIPDMKRDKAYRGVGLASISVALCLFMQGAKQSTQDEYLDAGASPHHPLRRSCVSIRAIDIVRFRGPGRPFMWSWSSIYGFCLFFWGGFVFERACRV